MEVAMAKSPAKPRHASRLHRRQPVPAESVLKVPGSRWYMGDAWINTWHRPRGRGHGDVWVSEKPRVAATGRWGRTYSGIWLRRATVCNAGHGQPAHVQGPRRCPLSTLHSALLHSLRVTRRATQGTRDLLIPVGEQVLPSTHDAGVPVVRTCMAALMIFDIGGRACRLIQCRAGVPSPASRTVPTVPPQGAKGVAAGARRAGHASAIPGRQSGRGRECRERYGLPGYSSTCHRVLLTAL